MTPGDIGPGILYAAVCVALLCYALWAREVNR